MHENEREQDRERKPGPGKQAPGAAPTDPVEALASPIPRVGSSAKWATWRIRTPIAMVRCPGASAADSPAVEPWAARDG